MRSHTPRRASLTHRSTGVPKLSALRILDEVAKLKQAQSTVKQTEERMDNVHMVRSPEPMTDVFSSPFHV